MTTKIGKDEAKQMFWEALDKQTGMQKDFADISAQAWSISQETARLLLSWGAALLPAALAALQAPFLEQGSDLRVTRHAGIWAEVEALAQQLNLWRGNNSYTFDPANPPTASFYSAQLRQLFRLTYLSLPEPNPVMLIIADHSARLSLLHSEPMALENKFIFMPLAEMLGMWDQRRQWQEQCLEIFAAKDKVLKNKYEAIKNLLGDPSFYTNQGVEDFLTRQGPDPKDSVTANTNYQRKATAYSRLKNKLTDIFRDQKIDDLLPTIELKAISPGSLLRHAQKGGDLEEVASRMRVMILCKTIDACYRVLGIVHQIGRPISQKFSRPFEDFIALPQPAGYQALHTTINYHPANSKSTLFEFRILTSAMHHLNEGGVLVALYQNPEDYRAAPAWWNQLSQLSKQISGSDDPADFQTFLKNHDLNSRSEKIYVFTPRGEIVILEDGSTPLDFAYHLHTELGNHAAQVFVNGQLSHYGYSLRNGDIVFVQYDSHFTGLDIAWCGFVHSKRTRSNIRKRLNEQAQSIHAGRAIIENMLLKTIQNYKEEKSYHLIITSQQLDTFLQLEAQARRLPNTQILYEQIQNKQIEADKLVYKLISLELSSALVDHDGYPIPARLPQITLCTVCRPVPGEPIVAIEKRSSNGRPKIMIHCANSQCVCQPYSGKQLSFRWAEHKRSGKELILFQISAQDHSGILHDLLEIIYNRPAVTLYKAEAQSFPDGSANINLAIEADSIERLNWVQQKMALVRGVLQILPFPPSLSQRLALVSPDTTYHANPYIEREVYDRSSFYDREELVRIIVQWIQGEAPGTWLILHGQRRVGKTSLLKHLQFEILPQMPSVLPVFITLQSLSSLNPQGLCRLIAQDVYNALQYELPKQLSREEPMEWLTRSLHKAARRFGGQLLIMMDEFDILLKDDCQPHFNSNIFLNLRAVMKELPTVSWILVIQDITFNEPERWRSAGPLFQEAIKKLAIPQFDEDWALKLMIEPMENCDLKYENSQIPKSIFKLTSGNPYLIKLICYQLVNRIRPQRTKITEDDLTQVVKLILMDGARYLDHFTGGERLNNFTKCVALAVANSDECAWQPFSQVVDQLQTRSRIFSAQSVQLAIKILENRGIVQTDMRDDLQWLRIPLSLLQQWLRIHLKFDELCEKIEPISEGNTVF